MLALTGVIVSIPVSRCSDFVVSTDAEGEGDTIEIMVENPDDVNGIDYISVEEVFETLYADKEHGRKMIE